MSPKNQRAPVGSSRTLAAVVAATSTSSSASQAPVSATSATSVIIGVTVSVGSVVLLVVAFRIWRCTRPPKAPLPPKGPLAHDRQRCMAAEVTQSQLPSSVPGRARGFVPLARNAPNSPYSDYSRQTGSRTDVASIPPSSSSIVSSQAHLVSESDEQAEMRRGRQPSMSSSGTARHYHNYRSRTVSNTGSVRSTRSRQSNQGTIRGPPHHRAVNIVLPKPLAPGLYNIDTLRQPLTHHARGYSSERHSESREREHRSGRVSMDDSFSSTHESTPHIPQHRSPNAAYPPPALLLRTEYPTAPSTPNPHVSHTSPADVSSPWSPNASVPLLTRSTPSPDPGPPPPPPPKDFPPRRPFRPRRNSDSAAGRQRPLP